MFEYLTSSKKILKLKSHLLMLELKIDAEPISSKKIEINYEIMMCKEQIKRKLLRELSAIQVASVYADETESDFRVEIIDKFIVATLDR